MEPRQERAKKVSIPVTRAFSMEIKFTRTPSNEKKGDSYSDLEMETDYSEPKENEFCLYTTYKWFKALSPETLYSLSKTISGLYCLLVISIYITVTVNKLVSSPMHAPEVEVSEFILNLYRFVFQVSALLMYLYLGSSIFLLYLLLHLARSPTSFDNVKSHGSGFLRQGAFVFGIGSFIYYLLEFITYFIIDLHPNCLDVLHTVNSFLSIIFVILQSVTIIMYPRLNISLGNGIPHLGLMHVVATNLIIWMRTVIKESLHAYHEAEETTKTNITSDHHFDYHNVSYQDTLEDFYEDQDHSIFKRSLVSHTIEHFDPKECTEKYHDADFVVEVLKASGPFLFCFIIEFSLVGSTLFYNTWNNVHTLTRDQVISSASGGSMRTLATSKTRRPNLCGTLAKTNWSHSTMGTVSGSMVLLLTLLDLIMFFSPTSYNQEAVFEYMGKVMNTFINFLGICSAIVGFVQIQKLKDKDKNSRNDNSVDLFLLDFGVFFIYIYSSLTITVGVFNIDASIPGSVHVLNGVMEIFAVTAQTILIHQLLLKTVESETAYLHGRQVVAFLSFLNFSIWLFDTFELPRSKASLVEANFYGSLKWVWLQRITLPVCIFFRFHSTVVLVDCWKNSYRRGAVEMLINRMNQILM